MKMNIEAAKVVCLDLQYYKRTQSMLRNKKPEMSYNVYFKIILKQINERLNLSEFKQTKEPASWKYVSHDKFDDIKKIFNTKLGLLLYLKDKDGVLRDMAYFKLNYFGDTTIPVIIQKPKEKYCVSAEEYNDDETPEEISSKGFNFFQ